MAHSPESVAVYVCANCQATLAGSAIQVSTGDHRYEPPDSCAACGEAEFVPLEKWVYYNCPECPRVKEEW